MQLFSAALQGLQQRPERWKDGVAVVNSALGEAVGQEYVRRHSQPAAKARMDAMVRNILAAYRVAIDSLEWMSPATKTQAQAKLAKLGVKIGYPDKWRDCSSLEIRRGDLVGNLDRARAFGYDYMLAQLEKPVDRARWAMTPQMVNAYYQERTSRLVGQYGAYEPIPGIRINGKLTLGENIGDISGIAAAYRAYRISLAGKEPPVIDGFTGEQRFFMGYAQIWRTKMREEAMRNLILTDPHTPGMNRAFVPLTNFEPFYRAWNVQPGDGMWRAAEERVRIW